jgi:probable lipoprotein NlpC
MAPPRPQGATNTGRQSGPADAKYSRTTIVVPVKSPPPSSCPWWRLLRQVALFGLFVNVVGCGLFEAREAPPPRPQPKPIIAPLPAPPTDDNALLRGHLYQHYQLWRGTPYRLGGMTTRGIDCSGFVLITFKALLDVRLPRTVEEQATFGHAIGPTDLRSGDLVFFRTGASMRHVGVYLEQGRFMHASTRRGVMISALADGYWRQRFWQARRIRGPQVAHENRGAPRTAGR